MSSGSESATANVGVLSGGIAEGKGKGLVMGVLGLVGVML